MIERPPALFRLTVPWGVFRRKGARQTVYLTFDDGPIPEVTPWVLRTIDCYCVKATFFMVGDNARRYPGLLQDVMARGHAIGNHTMHHLNGAVVDSKRYVADIMEADHILHTPLFRPPHGWLRPRQARALRGRFCMVMYDLVTRDYSSRLTADNVYDNVRRLARPGSIIVFHDSLRSWPRLQDALPRSIEWLLKEGYSFDVLKNL